MKISVKKYASLIALLLILTFLISDCKISNNYQNCKEIFKKSETYFSQNEFFNASKEYNTYIKTCINKDERSLFISYGKLFICLHRMKDKNANTLLDKALKHIPRLKDKVVQDLLFKLKYIDLQKKGDDKETIDLTQKEINKYEIGDTNCIEYIHTLGGIYQKIGNKDSALFYYSKAKQLLDKKKDKLNQLSADIYNTYAYCQRYYLNNPLNASKYYDSLLFISENTLHKDSDYYAWNLFNIGIYYQVMRANNKALDIYNKAFQIYSKIPGNFEEERSHIQIFMASIELYIGNIQKATDKINSAVRYYKSTNDYYSIANAYIFDAYLKVKLGKHIEALSIYKNYLKLADSLNLSTKEEHYQDIANCYVKTNQPDSAEYWFKQCFNTLNDSKNSHKILLHALLWDYLDFCMLTKNISKAEVIIQHYEKFLKNNYGSNSPVYAMMLLCKARISDYQKDYTTGIAYYLDALKILERKSYTKQHIEDNISLQHYSNLLAEKIIDCTIGLSRDFKELAENNVNQAQNLQSSLQYYAETQELMRQMRVFIPVEWDKLKFFEQYNNIKKEILEVKLAQYRVESNPSKKEELLHQAFEIADENKLSIMVENLKEKQVKQQLGIPDSTLEKEEKLTENINFMQHLIDDEEKQTHPNSDILKKYYGLIFKTYNEYDSLKEHLNMAFPAIQDIYGAQHSRMTYKQMVQHMPPNELLVEYAFTTDSLYTFTIHHRKISIFSAPIQQIQDNIRDFRSLLTNVTDSAYTQQGIAKYTTTSYNIYKQLVYPAIQNNHFERLTIIPDGILTFIPFEALVTVDKVPKNADYGALDYLCSSSNINYTYSLALYSAQLKNYSNVVSGIMGYAPSYDNSSPLSPLRNAGLRNKLKNLKGATEEVYNLVNTYGGRKIIGKGATESVFKQCPSRKQILHLAMHTIIDDENPMYSKLAFAEDKDSINEGFLNTYEIYPLKINSPLVVLSACNTGYGKLLDGEGIVNLTRGFYYAGCNSLLITLWNISDRSSVQLMKFFYKNLSEGKEKTGSLANAKIEYIANSDSKYAHPYYWAGFIHTGNASAVEMKKTEYRTYLILLVLLSLSLLLFNNKKKLK